MLSSRRTRVFFFAVLAFGTAGVAAGCADTDPHYGTPESIRGRQIDFGTGMTAPDPTTEGGAPGDPKALFNALFTTVQTTCTPCHAATGSGGVYFVAATPDAARTFFLMQKYNDLTQPPLHSFYNKGAHTGPALTPEQKTATKAWADAENAAGTPAPAPADAGAIVDAAGGG